MGLMKVFSGSEILALALKEKIEEIGIDVVMKDNIQSARLAGFGSSGSAVELFVQEIEFAQYEFDLSELYARKLRRDLYLNKGTFSDISFLQPLYDAIQKEYSAEHDIASNKSKLGQNEKLIKELDIEVLKRIQELSDFCKYCKPPKKKK